MLVLSLKKRRRKNDSNKFTQYVGYYVLLTYLGLRNFVIGFFVLLVFSVPLFFFEFCRSRKNQNFYVYLEQETWSSRKVLALDLDGTLVSASTIPVQNSVCIQTSRESLYVRTRPYLQEFLLEVSKSFELAVYTAGTQEYAEKVLSITGLDKLVSPAMRFYREHCKWKSGIYEKDLRLVGDLSRVILLDDTSCVCEKFRSNSLLIKSWNNGDDTELLKVLSVLDVVKNYFDVRCANLEILQHRKV